MVPRKIEIVCPKCNYKNRSIPADMGNQTIRCAFCGRYIHYSWRTGKIEITNRPERTTASGHSFF